MWDVLCITCQNSDLATEIEKDLHIYQGQGIIPKKTDLIVVADPKANIGSGGATFNAILTIAERLSIQLGYSVINIQALRNRRILIMHMGRDFQFDVAGRGLFYLPCTYYSPTSSIPIPNYLHTFIVITNQIAVDTPPGVWLTSTDIFATTSTNIYSRIDWSQQLDMLGLAVPAPVDLVANRHAAYQLNDDDTLANIFYRVDKEELRRNAVCPRYCSDDNVLALLGIVYLSPAIVESIVSFYEVYPLNNCTYMGVDSGATPIKLSILMDVMRAAASDVSEESFVNWSNAHPLARRARQQIYERLHNKVYRIVVDIGGQFLFPDIDRPALLYETLVQFCRVPSVVSGGSVKKLLHSHCYIESKVDSQSSIVINSCIGSAVSIGASAVIVHALLDVPAIIGDGSIINGLEATTALNNDLLNEIKIINIPPQIVLHQYSIKMPTAQFKTHFSVGVCVVFGLNDSLQTAVTKSPESTFCNIPFRSYIAKKEIDETDLWPNNMPADQRTLFTAKLYPVLSKAKILALALWMASPTEDPLMLAKWRSSWRLSIQDMQSLVDHSSAATHRYLCLTRVACKIVEREMANHDDAFLLPLYHTSVAFGFANALLNALDTVALQSLDERKLSRVLANIAALLACMSGSRGGIRSGPSRNAAWEMAYETLLIGDYERAIRAMTSLRKDWMDSPQTLMRASRHYEGACHILIRRACQTAQAFICLKPAVPSKLLSNTNVWVVAEAPCRADLAGGWSDTPPMSYEIGGAVLNVAVLLNGKRPVGAKIRRTDTPDITVCYLDSSGNGSIRQHWKFDSVNQLAGFDQPGHVGQATLVKACLYVTGVAHAVKGSTEPEALLRKQLISSFGAPGIEIHTWAYLPDGAGLGARSIMAGALIAAIWTLSGHDYDMECVCHAVVQCEQLMATCAGWQDPIGGLVGGVKLAYCQPSLPLHLRWRQIGFTAEALDKLNRRLVLIYAGNRPPFGASMAVYNVVRNWYSNEPKVVNAARRLATTANEAALLLENGVSSFDRLGALISQSHDLKKMLAPGSESESFHQIVDLLQSISLGATINGCGDGGFMTLFLTEEFCQNKTKNEIINEIQAMIASCDLRKNFGNEVSVYDAAIATDGMKVWHEVC